MPFVVFGLILTKQHCFIIVVLNNGKTLNGEKKQFELLEVESEHLLINDELLNDDVLLEMKLIEC